MCFTALTFITIPNSVAVIRTNAFASCGLEHVAIVGGSNLDVAIMGCAFERCRQLTEVEIPVSVTRLGHHAFAYCTALKKATIPSTVKRLEHRIFYMCCALVDVTMSIDSVDFIESGPFEGCHADLVLDIGFISNINAFHRSQYLNGIARSATLTHDLPDDCGSCVVRRVCPASTSFYGLIPPRHNATDEELPTLVDGKFITAPLKLQEPDGTLYHVYNWGDSLNRALKQLAEEQHSQLVGQNWHVLFPNMDDEVFTVSLQHVGDMVVQGLLDLTEPILIIFDRDLQIKALDEPDAAAAVLELGAKRRKVQKSSTGGFVCDVCC